MRTDYRIDSWSAEIFCEMSWTISDKVIVVDKIKNYWQAETQRKKAWLICIADFCYFCQRYVCRTPNAIGVKASASTVKTKIGLVYTQMAN